MASSVKTVSVDFPADIFGVEVNVPLIHQVVVAQQAAARQGTHATKTRGEVRGGGRKPYKQKGTGRARQGSTRAPQFAGGGTVHGPQPRNYSQRTPKKMVAAALRGALSDRVAHDRVHVVEALVTGETPSTKSALAALTGLADRNKFLVVLERSDAITWLSLRNAPQVHIVAVDQLNTYDVLSSDDVVFTKGAFDAFVAKAGAGKSDAATVQAEKPVKVEKPTKADKPAKVEKPAKAEKTAEAAEVKAFADVPAEETVEFAGAVKADEDGAGPEGYEIKGNAQSMKYHAPGGRWYDATIAEYWFKTAAEAEAAGFVEAGSKASIQANEEDDK